MFYSWTGPTTCASGTCTYSNAWYSKFSGFNDYTIWFGS